MNKILTIAALIPALFLFSCTKPKSRDFGHLVDRTASNKEAIRQIIANYRNTSGREEKEAYAYILDNIGDQYHINFKLEKDGRTVLLNGKIGMDSLISLQNDGFALNCQDTVHDIDRISPEDLHRHVQQFVSHWNNPQHRIKRAFPTHLKYALPYRTNNEPIETVFKMNLRYSVPDLIRKNAARDTIERIRKKVSAIAAQYSGKLDGVNLLNTVGPNDLLLRKAGGLLSDYEDRFVLEAGMLRQTGVPVATLFCPHRRYAANRPYSIHIVKDEHWIDSLTFDSIAKLYVSSFEAKDWDNPFDRLLSLGVERENIPLSLYIPKMQDVTDRATATGEIEYPVNGQTMGSMAKPILYLCTYSLGQWLPIDFSLVKDNKALFSKIGTNVLYLICTYAGGRLIPVSGPITLDGPRKQIEITGNETIIEVTLAQEGNNKPLQKNKAYSLYVWRKETGWTHLRDFTTGEERFYRTNMPEGMLYLVKGRESSFFAPRPFTLVENGQVWW